MEPIFKDYEFQCVLNSMYELKNNKQLQELEDLANQTLTQAKYRKNKYVICISYYYLAEVSFINGKHNKCIAYCWNIITEYKKKEYDELYALNCNLLGKAYGSVQDNVNALTFLLKGYYITLDQHLHDIEIRILSNIGTLYFHLEYYDDAINFYKKAMKKISQCGIVEESMYQVIMINIISVYVRKQDFDNVKKWEILFKKEFPNIEYTSEFEGYVANKILDSYRKQDHVSLEFYVEKLIKYSQQTWIDIYTKQLLFETAKRCLIAKQYKLVERCLSCAKEFIGEDDIRTNYQLSMLYVELYKAQDDTINLLKEYDNFYMLSKQNIEEDKRIEYQGLKNKLELEAELYAKQHLIKENAELSEKMEKDLFTGVLNKFSFIQKVDHDLSVITDDSYSILVVIDVDDFKGINDHYGHLVGDEVLKSISNVLLKMTNETDIVGRIGGDEFCIFMNCIKSMDLIKNKLNILMEEIGKIQISCANEYRIKVSIGVAGVRSSCDFKTLFEKADEALYSAKKKGKNIMVIRH